MRIYKNDIIKASAISTGADRGVLLCSITDSGFTSIAGVISAVKDRLPNEDHKKMVFEILNDTKKSTEDIIIAEHMKRVVVSYYHYSRKEKDRMSSQTDYVWETKNEEMFKYFEARRTKVFYSQIRAMCRFYGKKNVRKYKKL